MQRGCLAPYGLTGMKTNITMTEILRMAVKAVMIFTAIFFVLMLLPIILPALTGGTRSRHIDQQKHFAAMFKAGDTNAPLLAMDWFFDHGNYFCRVSQSGDVRSARDVGHAIQGGSGISSRFSLDSTNRPLLEVAINALPASSKKSLPKERQIWVSGIRSNQWFQFVYDRANIPLEVESLYGMTGAYLEWFIPLVGSKPDGVNHAMSQHDPNSFALAKNAPYAVSECGNIGLQIWKLNGWSPSKVGSLDQLPYPWKQNANELWSENAISPDGRTLIFAARDVMFAVDWQNQKLLWHADQMAWGNLYHAWGKTLAVDNEGKSLFVAVANSIERWNLVSGTKLGTLSTNNTGIKFLQTSFDGRFLIAGFGDNSFTIWNTDKDEPVYQFTEPAGADCMGISADGQRIALNSFGQSKLVIYDWQRGERKEFPLRRPYASNSAYSLCWSPDGQQLAAFVDTYPCNIIIYDTTFFKPIANWPCGAIGSTSIFAFNKEGRLFQMMDGVINSLDVTKLKPLGD